MNQKNKCCLQKFNINEKIITILHHVFIKKFIDSRIITVYKTNNPFEFYY